MKQYNKVLLLLAIFLFVFSCKEDNVPLPYLGKTTEENGITQYHTIPDWEYTNQDSVLIKNTDLEDYVYLVDFFFTSCPSICPRVAKEMLKIYDNFESEESVKLVSFTIDPKRDTPSKLKLYANNLGVNSDKWMFLTGDKDATFDLANEYFIVAYEDADSPGGFDHSGKIILIDKAGHIRSFSEGTDPSTTDKLISDTKKLLSEYDKPESK
jgi:protein SCO1/2